MRIWVRIMGQSETMCVCLLTVNLWTYLFLVLCMHVSTQRDPTTYVIMQGFSLLSPHPLSVSPNQDLLLLASSSSSSLHPLLAWAKGTQSHCWTTMSSIFTLDSSSPSSNHILLPSHPTWWMYLPYIPVTHSPRSFFRREKLDFQIKLQIKLRNCMA